MVACTTGQITPTRLVDGKGVEMTTRAEAQRSEAKALQLWGTEQDKKKAWESTMMKEGDVVTMGGLEWNVISTYTRTQALEDG